MKVYRLKKTNLNPSKTTIQNINIVFYKMRWSQKINRIYQKKFIKEFHFEINIILLKFSLKIDAMKKMMNSLKTKIIKINNIRINNKMKMIIKRKNEKIKKIKIQAFVAKKKFSG